MITNNTACRVFSRHGITAEMFLRKKSQQEQIDYGAKPKKQKERSKRPRKPCRNYTTIGPDERAGICKDYKDGMHVKLIAQRWGVSYHMVYKVTERSGLKRDRCIHVRDQIEMELKAGVEPEHVAAKLACTLAYVIKIKRGELPPRKVQ